MGIHRMAREGRAKEGKFEAVATSNVSTEQAIYENWLEGEKERSNRSGQEKVAINSNI